jgi:excisionase family DNA binding protein
LLGIGRSHLYKLLDAGKIPSRKDGRARVIAYEDLVAHRDSLPTVAPDDEPTRPLLLANERELELPAPGLAAVYAEQFKLIVPNLGPDEARLRAFEYTVKICRSAYRVDLETAKRMTSDAIKAARKS